MPEPRDPLLKVLIHLFLLVQLREEIPPAGRNAREFGVPAAGARAGRGAPGRTRAARRSNGLGNVHNGLGSFATL